jgi:hypothetical protein
MLTEVHYSTMPENSFYTCYRVTRTQGARNTAVLLQRSILRYGAKQKIARFPLIVSEVRYGGMK